MKPQIKSYFENLNPKQLSLKNKIKVNSMSKLGQGASNLNYLVKTNQGKFIFRMNGNPKKKNKSKKEYNALKLVKKENIAPKVYLIDDSKKSFNSDFLIIGYIEGHVCSKSKPYFNEKMIKKVARLLSKVHKIKITKKMKELEQYCLDYNDQLNSSNSYIRDIKKRIKNKKFLEMLENSFKNLRKKYIKKTTKSKLVFSQGDFHEWNIITNNNKLYLIDFEDAELTTQASSLAHIFVDFKLAILTKEQQRIFLEEYKKHIKTIKSLETEIEDFIPLKIMESFLWATNHALKIKNKELHEKFIEKNNHELDVNYAISCFKHALKFKVIDKEYKEFNLRRLLK